MLTAREAATDDDARIEYQKWICETKRKFSSEDEARKSAAESMERDQSLKALYTYRCAACGSLHLTRKKNRHVVASRTISQDALAGRRRE